MEVTVLGATGYTGRLCAAEAARRGLRLRLAGRRRDALEALRSDLGGGEVIVVDVTDGEALRRLAAATDVVLTTVGPYERLGRSVVEAVLAGGAHYLDVSGEVGFLSWAHGKHPDAVAAGVTAVPGAGFDGVPGELLAILAAARLDARPERVRVGYLVKGIRPSPGTVRSVFGVIGHQVAATRRWTIPFPQPLGSRQALSGPLPELVNVPRSLAGADVEAYLAVPAAQLAQAAARPLGVAARAAAGTPLWGWLERATGRLVRGPGEGARRRSRAAVLAEVSAGDAAAVAWARLSDVYGTTARIAVRIAERLLGGVPPSGVLSPGQVLADDAGAFLDEIGARWETLGVSTPFQSGTDEPGTGPRRSDGHTDGTGQGQAGQG